MSNGINLQNKRLILRDVITDSTGKITTEEIAIAYGALTEAFLDFLLIGLTIFIVVKFMNRLRAKAQDTKDVTVATPKDIQLLTDINVLMQEQNELLKASINTKI